MTKRARPRVDKAARMDDDRVAIADDIGQQILESLPEITEQMVRDAKDGDFAARNRIFDFAQDLIRDAETRRGNDILDRIERIRVNRVEDILVAYGERNRHEPDLATASPDGAEHTDTRRETGDLVSAVNPASPDQERNRGLPPVPDHGEGT